MLGKILQTVFWVFLAVLTLGILGLLPAFGILFGY